MISNTIFFTICFALYSAVTISILASGFAGKLGRDVDVWALAGFFFGPIALAILYAKGPKVVFEFFPVSDDERRRWEALVRADQHIGLAAAKAREVSASCERDLMLMYFAVNDRQRLPHLLKTAIEAAEIRKREATKAIKT